MTTGSHEPSRKYGMEVIDTSNDYLRGAYRYKGICHTCGFQTHQPSAREANDMLLLHGRRHRYTQEDISKPADVDMNTGAPVADRLVGPTKPPVPEPIATMGTKITPTAS